MASAAKVPSSTSAFIKPAKESAENMPPNALAITWSLLTTRSNAMTMPAIASCVTRRAFAAVSPP